MTRQELDTLWELACKLRNERLEEIKKDYDYTEEELQELVNDPYNEDLYDIDDGDNLLQGLDIVIGVVEEMKPTK